MTDRPDRTRAAEPVTLLDIARKIGVNKSTVQRALSGAGRISGATTERIRTLAKKLGYDPGQQQAARRLAYRKHGKVAINRMIALFFPPGFFRVNYFLRLYQGILEALVPAKYDLMTTYFEAPTADTMPNSLVRGDVDGALALASTPSVKRLFAELDGMQSFAGRPFLSREPDTRRGIRQRRLRRRRARGRDSFARVGTPPDPPLPREAARRGTNCGALERIRARLQRSRRRGIKRPRRRAAGPPSARGRPDVRGDRARV